MTLIEIFTLNNKLDEYLDNKIVLNILNQIETIFQNPAQLHKFISISHQINHMKAQRDRLRC